MLKIVTTILCVYMLVRCVLPLRCKRPLKMLLALLVLLVGFRLHIFSLLYATFNPELPRWILISTGVPACALLPAGPALAAPGRRLPHLVAGAPPASGLPALPGSNRQMAALLLVALVMTFMAVPAALRVPDVRTQEIVLPGLPPALDGLRVAQLTDLHISRNFPAEWTRAVVDRTNALRPDIILLTGDLMDGSPALRREDFAPMATCRAPLGVFACPGNHEYYSDLPAWRPVLRAHGITLLENEAAVLPVRGSHLTVAGVTDNVAGRFGLPGPRSAQGPGGDARDRASSWPTSRSSSMRRPRKSTCSFPAIPTAAGPAAGSGRGPVQRRFRARLVCPGRRPPVCGPRQRPVGRFSPAPGRAFRDPAAGPARAAMTHRPPGARLPAFFPLPQAGHPLEHRDFIPHPSCLPLRQALH